jgi:Peptidase_C39 like family
MKEENSLPIGKNTNTGTIPNLSSNYGSNPYANSERTLPNSSPSISSDSTSSQPKTYDGKLNPLPSRSQEQVNINKIPDNNSTNQFSTPNGQNSNPYNPNPSPKNEDIKSSKNSDLLGKTVKDRSKIWITSAVSSALGFIAILMLIVTDFGGIAFLADIVATDTGFKNLICSKDAITNGLTSAVIAVSNTTPEKKSIAAKFIGDKSLLAQFCDLSDRQNLARFPPQECGSIASAGVCIGKLLDEPGDTVKMFKASGTEQIKKSVINEVIQAASDEREFLGDDREFVIKYILSVHPTESSGSSWNAKNADGCVGIFQLCPQSFSEAGFSNGIPADYLGNKRAQVKAAKNFINKKRSYMDSFQDCVKKHFIGKSEIYKLGYLTLGGVCPGGGDSNGTGSVQYGVATEANFNLMGCNELKTKFGLNENTNNPIGITKDFMDKLFSFISFKSEAQNVGSVVDCTTIASKVSVPPGSVVLDVPYFNQWLDKSPPTGWQMCGAASSVMVTAYYKKIKNFNPSQIKNYMYQDMGQGLPRYCDSSGAFSVTGKGFCDQSSVAGIKEYLSFYGLKSGNLESITFEQVKNAIDKNHPVILSTTYPYGHIFVAKGYTPDGRIIVNDSYKNHQDDSWNGDYKNPYSLNGESAIYDINYKVKSDGNRSVQWNWGIEVIN